MSERLAIESTVRDSRAWRPLAALVPALALSLGGWPAQATELADVAPSVVQVLVYDDNDDVTALGSGFVISDQGHIVTNAHVIEPTAAMEVLLPPAVAPGEPFFHSALLRYHDEDLDIAILQARSIGPDRAATLNIADIEDGATVMIAGFPGDEIAGAMAAAQGELLSQGTVPAGAGELMLIQHDAVAAISEDGSPLFNNCGEVVGIGSFVMTDSGEDSTFGSISVLELGPIISEMGIAVSASSTACGGSFSASSWLSPARLVTYAVIGLLAGALVAFSKRRRQSPAPATPDAPPPAREDEPDQEQTSSDMPLNTETLCVLSTSTAEGRDVEVELTADDFLDANDGCVIGRNGEVSHLEVDDETLSKRHARILHVGGSFRLEDLNSSNGTFIADRQLKPFQPEPLKSGDVIRLGGRELLFQTS